jgi:ActR/RegA family two-component response regulator
LLVIVDSDTAAAHELSHGLAAVGFDVRGPARTLADARKLLRLVVPDIALIGMQLADGESGLALAHELRARGTRVVIMGAAPATWTGICIRRPFVSSDVVDLLAFQRDVADATKLRTS